LEYVLDALCCGLSLVLFCWLSASTEHPGLIERGGIMCTHDGKATQSAVDLLAALILQWKSAQAHADELKAAIIDAVLEGREETLFMEWHRRENDERGVE